MNHELNLHVLKVLPKSGRIVFVPSGADPEREKFEEFKEWFEYYGYKRITFFNLDKNYDGERLDEVIGEDAIYLSGGNTFNFLYNVRRQKFDQVLKNHVDDGKLLIGISAGSYSMTPSIGFTALHHKLIGDLEELNSHGISDYSSLGFVDFEIIPHYQKKVGIKVVKEYIGQCKRELYGIHDGSGVFVTGEELEFDGQIERLSL